MNLSRIKFPLKSLLVILTMLSARAIGLAPDSVEGMTFHPSAFVGSDRQGIFCVTSFLPNSRYAHVLWASGSALDQTTSPRLKLGYNQPTDGTFTYTRLDDTRAQIVEIDSTGRTEIFDLTFTTPRSGNFRSTHGVVTESGFYLSERSEFEFLPLVNTSVRGFVGGGHTLIAGIVIPGTVTRSVLIRAVGPGLARFGVTDFLSDPDFSVHSAKNPDGFFWWGQVHRTDWTMDQQGVDSVSTARAFETVFSTVGAFPLTEGSKDAVEVRNLTPGAYTIVCAAPEGASSGEVLLEVYLIP